MNETIIKIDEALATYIESLQYEVNARRDIISFMLERDMDTSSKAFEQYQKEYNELFVQYTTAKDELEKRFVIPAVGDQRVGWNLDFATKEVTITAKE